MRYRELRGELQARVVILYAQFPVSLCDDDLRAERRRKIRKRDLLGLRGHVLRDMGQHRGLVGYVLTSFGTPGNPGCATTLSKARIHVRVVSCGMNRAAS